MTLYNMLEYAKKIKCYIGILVKGQCYEKQYRVVYKLDYEQKKSKDL